MSTDENPFDTGVDNPGYDEAGENIEMGNLNPYDSSRSGSSHSTVIRHHSGTQEETSFGGDASETDPLLSRMKSVDDTWKRIKRKFPNVNTVSSTFTARLDDLGQVMVRLNRKYYPLFKGNGELNGKLPKTIKESLGPPAEDIVKTNKEEIAGHQERIDELQEQLEKTAEEHMREGLNQTIDEEMDIIAQLERANEEIEQRMTLRDRVKTIIRKYGFTLLAVASAVGLVIGVIVTNLKNGLTSLGKGVSGKLKTIGKKLGEILPGLVGAITSFVFRTAGEVVGFLAKNAWLLIVGVVIYLVEQFKKKK